MRFMSLALGVLAVAATMGACDDGNDNTGTAGTTVVQSPGAGGTTGSAGTSVAGVTGAAGTTGEAGTTGAAGTGATFVSIDPCPFETDYVATTTITVSPTVIGYSPKCVKIPAGAAVTIGASAFHPLSGTTLGSANNPIPLHQTSPATVTFPTPGFYSFQCDVHFLSGMMGVIWVQ